ncbi:hypothetical protein PPNSA23_41070 [Phyllobacterium phragmitis]|uniref:Uncharacterized protein n=1 Tax=Phyllobacterium phragmitis TaxID=2670329 RepID=A0ABQ0H5G0_9HYPH
MGHERQSDMIGKKLACHIRPFEGGYQALAQISDDVIAEGNAVGGPKGTHGPQIVLFMEPLKCLTRDKHGDAIDGTLGQGGMLLIEVEKKKLPGIERH